MAALAAPFKPKDAALFSIISGFDAAYSAYSQFQNGLERFWTLRYLTQENITELTAVAQKDGWARAESLPLVLRVAGAENLPRGARIQIAVASVNLLTLEAHARLLTRLDPEVQSPTSEAEAAAQQAEEDDGDDGAAAGPLSLAIDVHEEDPPNDPEKGDNPGSSAQTAALDA
jgi:exoribonuclease-2